MDFAHARPVRHGLLVEAVDEPLRSNGHLLPVVGGGDLQFGRVVVGSSEDHRLRLGAVELEPELRSWR